MFPRGREEGVEKGKEVEASEGRKGVAGTFRGEGVVEPLRSSFSRWSLRAVAYSSCRNLRIRRVMLVTTSSVDRYHSGSTLFFFFFLEILLR